MGKAGDEMVRGDFLELGNAFAAELVAFKAPVGKAAFLGQVDGLVISPFREMRCRLWERSGTGMAESRARV